MHACRAAGPTSGQDLSCGDDRADLLDAAADLRVRRCANHFYVDADLRSTDARLFTGIVPSPQNTGVFVSTVTCARVEDAASVRITLQNGKTISATAKVAFVHDFDVGNMSESGVGFVFTSLGATAWVDILDALSQDDAQLFEQTVCPSPENRVATPAPAEAHAFLVTLEQAIFPLGLPESRFETVVAEAIPGVSRDQKVEMGFIQACRTRLFVSTPWPRPVEARLDLWLFNADTRDGAARLRGTVRWVRRVRRGASMDDQLAGMGVELDAPGGVDGWDGCLLCWERSSRWD